MIVKTPSGFSVEIRKLKGSEANNLANKRLARKGEVFDTVLGAITRRVEDAGPYRFLSSVGGPTRVDWSRVLVCDRFYTLVAARLATYGPEYLFPVQCVACEHPFEWELDIENDIPVYDLPEASREKIAAGENRFEAEADGRTITFRLLDGKAERDAGQRLIEMKGEIVTRSIAARILSVEGIKGKGRFFRDRVNEWLETVDNDELVELLAKMEAVDGGFETDHEIQCPKCDRIFEVNIPFEGAPFWMPRSKSTKAAKAARPARTMAGRPLDSAETDPDPEETDSASESSDPKT